MNADGPEMTGFTDIATDTDAHAALPGWEGILDPGEQIVWQGRPDQGFHMAGHEIPATIFGVFFAGFALVWMILAATAGGAFWMFGLIHFSVGLNLIWKTVYGETQRRRQTWYTLTDKRAFIATDSARKGKQLDSYPITPDTNIRYQDGPPATIHFAHDRRTGSKGRSYTVPIGFERIAEGPKVLALLREAQRRKADT